MNNEFIQTADACEASVIKGSGLSEITGISGYYTAECYDAAGNLKWRDEIHNLVTTVGKNKILDIILGNTAAGAVVMGLKATGTAVVGDTQASHASWTEVGGANAPAYSGNRPTPTFGAASAGSKATSTAVSFTFTSGGTVAGCFINIGGLATKDDTTGTLFSAGDFATAKTVATSDQLNVTYTATVA